MQQLSIYETQAERFSLIPLNGKVPIEKDWVKWCGVRSEYDPWKFDGHNAGICCGPASGVIVLDIDDPSAFETLIEANGLSIPETYTVETGSGKPHYYFQYPDNGTTYGNKGLSHPVSKHTIFDIRGSGGQVVAAGSVHPDTGELYKIAKDIDIAPMPDWMVGLYDGESLDTDVLWDVPLPKEKDGKFMDSLKVSQAIKDLILQGKPKLERSEAIGAVLKALNQLRLDERLIFYIFDHYPIGEKYREKGNSKDNWLRGEINRSKEYLRSQAGNNTSFTNSQGITEEQSGDVSEAEAAIQSLNEKHAAVMYGGKFSILNEVYDPVFKRHDVTFSSKSDFQNCYASWKVANPNSSGPRQVNATTVWLDSPDRRQYDGIVFSPAGNIPGYYNLYRGFGVDPVQGDWSLFKKHIWEVIANKDKEIYAYLIAWMAQAVQEPGGKRPGTAIVLRGKQGTGKGCFVSNYGAIFGSHYLHLTDQEHITGRFNGHLKSALLLYCDEGFWAGDKSAAGKLKGMITEDEILIEMKNKEPLPLKNHMRFIFSSNYDWIVPAEFEERRFLVLDVSDEHMKDQPYFKAVFNQMDNGGREAMLYDLLHHDYSGIDLRTIPRTAALMDQIVNSMSPVQKFYYDKLCDRYLSDLQDEWTEAIPISKLYDDYLELARNVGARFKLSKSEFGKELKKFCPGIAYKKQNSHYPGYDGRINHYVLPELNKCRQKFEDLVNIPIDWDKMA